MVYPGDWAASTVIIRCGDSCWLTATFHLLFHWETGTQCLIPRAHVPASSPFFFFKFPIWRKTYALLFWHAYIHIGITNKLSSKITSGRSPADHWGDSFPQLWGSLYAFCNFDRTSACEFRCFASESWMEMDQKMLSYLKCLVCALAKRVWETEFTLAQGKTQPNRQIHQMLLEQSQAD